ncbi:MAG: acetate--CoA ligase family protein [Chloroflexota bacterium]|nr:acetate--CoA ligase family protein [Chloroflexota bacterium]
MSTTMGADAPRGGRAPAPDPRLQALLRPVSIAVIGATERPQYGGRFVANLQATGFAGRLYPVNPNRETVFALRCYPTIGAVPEPVDLAAVIIPAAHVLDTLEQCVAAGVRAAVVISADFAEVGGEGVARQAAVAGLARRTGLRVLGPNCLGLANVAEGIWATASTPIAAADVPPIGPIGLISQSGASAFGPLLNAFRDRGIGIRYLVSTGNEVDVELSELIRAMLNDPEVRAVAAFVEGFRDPAGFLACADEALALGKPIVLLKVGRSGVGQKAAATHTAALTGSDAVQDAIFRQRGIVRADDFDELAEFARLLAYAPLPRGDRVGVISHSGGITGLLGDKIGEQSLVVPPLEAGTLGRLAEILEGRGAATNPADITGHFQRETFPEILALVTGDPNVDLVAVATAGPARVVQRVVDAAEATDKPLAFVWTGSLYDADGLPHLRASRLPAFHLPGRAARGLRALVDHARVRRRVAGGEVPWAAPASGGELRLPEQGGAVLAEVASLALLGEAGLPVERGRLCGKEDEAAAAARALGYPVVVKAASNDVLHKTEGGAVWVGIADEPALRAAFRAVLENIRRHRPEARVDGVLVQPMLAGVEVIAGISQDPQFGPVLLLGLGGTLAEALAVTSLRLCPIGADDAREMISEVRGLDALLEGFRGSPPADREALVAALVRLSQVGWANRDRLASVDLNPIIVLPSGEGVRIVDALIVPGTPA